MGLGLAVNSIKAPALLPQFCSRDCRFDSNGRSQNSVEWACQSYQCMQGCNGCQACGVVWQTLVGSKGLEKGYDRQAKRLDSVCPIIVDRRQAKTCLGTTVQKGQETLFDKARKQHLLSVPENYAILIAKASSCPLQKVHMIGEFLESLGRMYYIDRTALGDITNTTLSKSHSLLHTSTMNSLWDFQQSLLAQGSRSPLNSQMRTGSL